MQTPTLSVLTAQPSTEGTLAHRCSRRPFRRARETGLPTISMDSNSGGDTRRPDIGPPPPLFYKTAAAAEGPQGKPRGGRAL